MSGKPMTRYRCKSCDFYTELPDKGGWCSLVHRDTTCNAHCDSWQRTVMEIEIPDEVIEQMFGIPSKESIDKMLQEAEAILAED